MFRVLIVDDEPLIRWSLAETLADQGYGVLQAGDGIGQVYILRAWEFRAPRWVCDSVQHRLER